MILLAFIVSVAIFFIALGYLEGWTPPAIAPLRDDVQAVIDLLRLDRDWRKGPYTWFHPSGVNVWVANKDYGLDVVLDAKNENDYSTAGSPKATSMKLDDRHRRAIWRVVQEIKESRARVDADAAAKAVAKRVLEMYPDLRA